MASPDNNGFEMHSVLQRSRRCHDCSIALMGAFVLVRQEVDQNRVPNCAVAIDPAKTVADCAPPLSNTRDDKGGGDTYDGDSDNAAEMLIAGMNDLPLVGR